MTDAPSSPPGPQDTFDADIAASPVKLPCTPHSPQLPARPVRRHAPRPDVVAALSAAAVLGAVGAGALSGARSTPAVTAGAAGGASWVVAGWAALSTVVMPMLMKINAPYGRHVQGSGGPTIPSGWGWCLMEAPAAVVTGALALGGRGMSAASGALLGMWQLHYINRAFIYPWRQASPNKPMPLSMVASAFVFNAVNGYFNGQLLAQASYPNRWLLDPRFLVGMGLFGAGFIINQQADTILLNLRKPGETGYKIPQGGMYPYISCPNYLGEMMEWAGWALASWSMQGTAFAMWTVANLFPRALANHRWYKERFADYPSNRKAILPGLI